MTDLLIIDLASDDLEWRCWEYDSSGAAAVWFERLVKETQRLGKRHATRVDVGMWRSRTPDRKRHFIMLGGRRADVEALEQRITWGALRHDMPDDATRMALWTSHVSKVVAEHERTGQDDVTTRHRHGGKFLHSDGTMHAFPEPRGRG